MCILSPATHPVGPRACPIVVPQAHPPLTRRYPPAHIRYPSTSHLLYLRQSRQAPMSDSLCRPRPQLPTSPCRPPIPKTSLWIWVWHPSVNLKIVTMSTPIINRSKLRSKWTPQQKMVYSCAFRNLVHYKPLKRPQVFKPYPIPCTPRPLSKANLPMKAKAKKFMYIN